MERYVIILEAYTFSLSKVPDAPCCGSQETDSHTLKDQEQSLEHVPSVPHLQKNNC